jgi:hypothetical protein
MVLFFRNKPTEVLNKNPPFTFPLSLLLTLSFVEKFQTTMQFKSFVLTGALAASAFAASEYHSLLSSFQSHYILLDPWAISTKGWDLTGICRPSGSHE